MPLPQSRIGRAVLLGIVLGLLAVFAAAAFASIAHAQESPLPQSPDNGAVGPAVGESADKAAVGPAIDDAKLRDPEGVACRTAEALLKLYPFDAGRDWQNNWLKSLNYDARQLGIYCGERGDLRSDNPEKRRRWILGVRGYDFRFTRLVIEAAAKPQTPKSRQRLAKFEDIITELHFDADTLLTWEMLRLATPIIVEVPREVIRTVEVPVRCAEPPPMMRPVRSACEAALHDSLTSWYDGLYRKQDEFFGIPIVCGSGCEDEEWANRVREDINRVSPDSFVAPHAMGWLASYRAMRRVRHGIVDSKVEQVAADMRAKLAFCGMQQADWER